MPAKWLEKHVNTVQIHFQLVNVNIQFFNYSGSSLPGTIEISHEGDKKHLLYSIGGKAIFELHSKWLYVSAVTGYLKEGA